MRTFSAVVQRKNLGGPVMRAFSGFSRAIAAAAAVSFVTFGSAFAGEVVLSDIKGSWINVDPNSGISVYDNDSASPSMRWGTAATSRGRSGYDFDASSDITTDVPPDQQVTLGQFVHRNNPIRGTSLESATLQIDLNVSVDGNDLGMRTFFFDFTHDETNNSGSFCCNDLITVSTNSMSQMFEMGGVNYTLSILGFNVNGNIVDTFSTKEKKNNYAYLVASIMAMNEVPLPAALPLFLAGLAGLGFAGRGRKAKQQQA